MSLYGCVFARVFDSASITAAVVASSSTVKNDKRNLSKKTE